MNKEYIEKEAALTEFSKVCDLCMALITNPMCDECSVADTVRKIKHIPPANVAPIVYGEWIDTWNTQKHCNQSFCSACGERSGIGGIKSNRHKPFCPNCGAKMKNINKGS